MRQIVIVCDNCGGSLEIVDIEKEDGTIYVAVCRKCWREAYGEGFRSGWYEAVIRYQIDECEDKCEDESRSD